ncbi:unnamed protein product [Auanema sp. JU1783]|nr:unnamed protein product [Auanema sp. JU1783]
MLKYCIFILFITFHICQSISCTSNEYCPNGWSILRRDDQSAHTCDPLNGNTKCPKPYRCVHSKCGLSFCCADAESLRRWKRAKEIEDEMLENADDEL